MLILMDRGLILRVSDTAILTMAHYSIVKIEIAGHGGLVAVSGFLIFFRCVFG